jgi:imidazoleglycerol-phosphate dehydratase / histidinol-phosphatase
MKKYLFIDRDGTIIESPPSPLQIETIKDVVFLPEVILYLGKIAKELNFELVMVTNQNGLGTVNYPLQKFETVQNYILNELKLAGVVFSEIIIDGSMPEEKSNLRKPRVGRMQAYINNSFVDLRNSFVIGDRLTDVQFAKNLGCKAIMLNPENLRGVSELTDSIDILKNEYTNLATHKWSEVYQYLITQN